MPTSISTYYNTIMSLILVVILVFLGYIFFYKKQDTPLNWAIFYGTLYVAIVLPVMNHLCILLGLWDFDLSHSPLLGMPVDLYFIWVIIWSVIPIYFLKGRYSFILCVLFLWLDLLIMPELQNLGIVSLSKNWILGEILLLVSVFLPSYFWAHCSIQQKYHGIRAMFQVIIMAILCFLAFPYMATMTNLMALKDFTFNSFVFQLLLISIFPGLIAVWDMIQKGKGTPFPYDPTQVLVQNGIYAYIRNPIQWSFAALFLPMCLFFSTPLFILGIVFTISYTIGVSDFQEHTDMQNRFGKQWTNYKANVPNWRFLWKPRSIPKGTIYFDTACNHCKQVMDWFAKKETLNLEIKPSHQCQFINLQQVTYIDYNGYEYKSVEAIAHGLEHINLAFATLGWFMRFPGIKHLLQLIIDSMELGRKQECEL